MYTIYTLYIWFNVLDIFQTVWHCSFFSFNSQVKEAMQRIHDRGNIGKLILDVEKSPTPLVKHLNLFWYLFLNEIFEK